MLRFGEARDAHGVTWRFFSPAVFNSFYLKNRWQDWISFFRGSNILQSSSRLCSPWTYTFECCLGRTVKALGDGHMVIWRHWMMAMRGLRMWMSWPQIATKVVVPADDFGRYRSAIGASAICLFGWRHKGLKPPWALAGKKASGWSWASIVFVYIYIYIYFDSEPWVLAKCSHSMDWKIKWRVL